MKEAAVIFAFYTTGVLVFAYLAAFHIRETEYFNGEDDVVIPKHVLEEHHMTEVSVDGEKVAVEDQSVTVGDNKA